MLFQSSWHKGGHRSSTINACPFLKYPPLHLLSVIVSLTFGIFISSTNPDPGKKAFAARGGGGQAVKALPAEAPAPESMAKFAEKRRPVFRACAAVCAFREYFGIANDRMPAPLKRRYDGCPCQIIFCPCLVRASLFLSGRRRSHPQALRSDSLLFCKRHLSACSSMGYPAQTQRPRGNTFLCIPSDEVRIPFRDRRCQ